MRYWIFYLHRFVEKYTLASGFEEWNIETGKLRKELRFCRPC